MNMIHISKMVGVGGYRLFLYLEYYILNLHLRLRHETMFRFIQL